METESQRPGQTPAGQALQAPTEGISNKGREKALQAGACHPYTNCTSTFPYSRGATPTAPCLAQLGLHWLTMTQQNSPTLSPHPG